MVTVKLCCRRCSMKQTLMLLPPLPSTSLQNDYPSLHYFSSFCRSRNPHPPNHTSVDEDVDGLFFTCGRYDRLSSDEFNLAYFAPPTATCACVRCNSFEPWLTTPQSWSFDLVEPLLILVSSLEPWLPFILSIDFVEPLDPFSDRACLRLESLICVSPPGPLE